MFMSSDNVAKTTVAESLKEKLTAKQTELGSRLSGKYETMLMLAIIQDHLQSCYVGMSNPYGPL